MSQTVKSLYSSFENIEDKKHLMLLISRASTELTSEKIISGFVSGVLDNLRSDDPKVRSDEAIRLAVEFGKNLVKKDLKRTDKNGNKINCLVVDADTAFINCFCIYLIDYISGAAEVSGKKLIAVAPRGEANSVHSYEKAMKAVSTFYTDVIIRCVTDGNKDNSSSSVKSVSKTDISVHYVQKTSVTEKNVPPREPPKYIYDLSDNDNVNFAADTDATCYACGFINRPQAVYCRKCGSLLKNSHTKAEFKTILINNKFPDAVVPPIVTPGASTAKVSVPDDNYWHLSDESGDFRLW